MMELANWAPTHRRTEPWRFFVYEGEAFSRFIDTLCDLYVRTTPSEEFNPQFLPKMQDRKSRVSHLIVLAYERHEEVPEFEEQAALAMAVQNMWLYASSQRIGSYWSTPQVALSPLINQLDELPSHLHYQGLFYLGALDEQTETRKGQRGNWQEKVNWFKN
jgi:nitroreductase